MMIAFQKALLNRMTYSFLLRNRSRETLIQCFWGPGFQRRIHFGLFLAPGYFEGLMFEQEGFGGCAEVGDARFEVEDVLG